MATEFDVQQEKFNINLMDFSKVEQAASMFTEVEPSQFVLLVSNYFQSPTEVTWLHSFIRTRHCARRLKPKMCVTL
jgi:hypothetical protein